MYIQCDNINDFCTMITTCSLNGINDVRLFISEEDSYKQGLITPASIKDHKSFTYVLFTPLYTAIYNGNIINTEYEKIYKTLENCQEQCDHNFRIQIFDKLSFDYDKGYLTIGTEINVI